MTVGDIKDNLKDVPDDREFIISVDGEGNEFKKVDTLEIGLFYSPHDAYSGDVTDECDAAHDAVAAVVAYPGS